MTHSQAFLERLFDEGALSRCLQTAFSKKLERPAVDFRFSQKRGRRSRNEKLLKPREIEDVSNDEREKLESYFWVWRPVYDRELGIFGPERRRVSREVKQSESASGREGEGLFRAGRNASCAGQPRGA